MNNMFTSGELKALSILLKRVNITGEEALVVSQLQVKLQNLLSVETSIEEPKTETPTSE